MQTPLHVIFRRLPCSEALLARIEAAIRRLERRHRMAGCRVVIEAPAGGRVGAPFAIKIELTVRRQTLCVDTSRVQIPAHTDAHVALRDAFAALARRLLTHDKQRIDARRRAAPLSSGDLGYVQHVR